MSIAIAYILRQCHSTLNRHHGWQLPWDFKIQILVLLLFNTIFKYSNLIFMDFNDLGSHLFQPNSNYWYCSYFRPLSRWHWEKIVSAISTEWLRDEQRIEGMLNNKLYHLCHNLENDLIIELGIIKHIRFNDEYSAPISPSDFRLTFLNNVVSWLDCWAICVRKANCTNVYQLSTTTYRELWLSVPSNFQDPEWCSRTSLWSL